MPAVAKDTSKFEPFATYWDDDLDKVPPPPAGSPPAIHLIFSGLQPQSPPGPPPSYTPQQQLVTNKIPADTPMTVATALQPPSTTASFLPPLDGRDTFHMEVTESPKHAPTPVVTAPTQTTARMIKRWQRNPATVAWDRVVTICRHRRQWDTSLDYRTKRAAEGSYRDLPGQGLVHGGPWVPRSARDDPVKRGRAIDTDREIHRFH